MLVGRIEVVENLEETEMKLEMLMLDLRWTEISKDKETEKDSTSKEGEISWVLKL